jgi:hypothetical protein
MVAGMDCCSISTTLHYILVMFLGSTVGSGDIGMQLGMSKDKWKWARTMDQELEEKKARVKKKKS